jgi:hypothetical protein
MTMNDDGSMTEVTTTYLASISKDTATNTTKTASDGSVNTVIKTFSPVDGTTLVSTTTIDYVDLDDGTR